MVPNKYGIMKMGFSRRGGHEKAVTVKTIFKRSKSKPLMHPMRCDLII
jgi:hypothetical protein